MKKVIVKCLSIVATYCISGQTSSGQTSSGQTSQANLVDPQVRNNSLPFLNRWQESLQKFENKELLTPTDIMQLSEAPKVIEQRIQDVNQQLGETAQQLYRNPTKEEAMIQQQKDTVFNSLSNNESLSNDVNGRIQELLEEKQETLKKTKGSTICEVVNEFDALEKSGVDISAEMYEAARAKLEEVRKKCKSCIEGPDETPQCDTPTMEYFLCLRISDMLDDDNSKESLIKSERLLKEAIELVNKSKKLFQDVKSSTEIIELLTKFTGLLKERIGLLNEYMGLLEIETKPLRRIHEKEEELLNEKKNLYDLFAQASKAKEALTEAEF